MSLRALYVVLVALAAPAAANAQAVSDSGTFLVRRGKDTVATEQFVRTAIRLQGILALRNAKRTSERWTAVIAPDATLPLIEVTVQEGNQSLGAKARITQRARVIFKEDSAAVDDLGQGGIQTRLFATEIGAVPYLNLSFALLEQAVRRARASDDPGQVPLFNLGGGQTVLAKLSRTESDSVLLQIGDVRYDLRVDSTGRLLGARILSQGVVVERR